MLLYGFWDQRSSFCEELEQIKKEKSSSEKASAKVHFMNNNSLCLKDFPVSLLTDELVA